MAQSWVKHSSRTLVKPTLDHWHPPMINWSILSQMYNQNSKHNHLCPIFYSADHLFQLMPSWRCYRSHPPDLKGLIMIDQMSYCQCHMLMLKEKNLSNNNRNVCRSGFCDVPWWLMHWLHSFPPLCRWCPVLSVLQKLRALQWTIRLVFKIISPILLCFMCYIVCAALLCPFRKPWSLVGQTCTSPRDDEPHKYICLELKFVLITE